MNECINTSQHEKNCYCDEPATVHITYGSGCGNTCETHAQGIEQEKGVLARRTGGPRIDGYEDRYVYIVRPSRNRIVTAAGIKVFPREKRRQKRVMKLADGTPFGVEVEHDGWDHSQLSIRTFGQRNGRGVKTTQYGALCDKTAKGLKSVLRRIRPEERDRIESYDADIAYYESLIAHVRRERAGVVAEAWAKGHVVPLNSLEVITPKR